MSVIKVNPKLFGTCRLCLEEMGQYLIMPKVQEQIKYCFDINVEPFDGLPQLLCNKCGDILKEFFETKKKIVDKQNDLLNKIENEKIQKQHSEKNNVSKKVDNESDPPKTTTAKKKQIVLSFSCSRADPLSQCILGQNKKDSMKSKAWLSDYTKQYACKLCNYRGRKKQNIFRHTSTCHKNLKIKYQNVLKNDCRIKLDKLDKLPNLTGWNDTVVISSERIVQEVDKNYGVIYTSKVINRLVEKKEVSDISDESEARKKQKTSDETIKSKKEDSQQDSCNTRDESKENDNGDCIKIDDSSDSASENNFNSKQDEPNSNSAVSLQKIIPTCTIQDHSTKIRNIISMCHSKYKKNIDLHMHNKQSNNPAISKSQLKHKVLSIGRKIINKQGFNCTGLLRYMEHRNLEILWTPNISNYNIDTNYVRIMTKLSANVVDEDDIGWKTCKMKSKDTGCIISNDPPMPKISQVFYSDQNTHWKVDTKNKLLNKNPVANPKQMPRKTAGIGKYNEPVSSLTQTGPNNNQNVSNQNELFNSAYGMPDLSPISSVTIQENCILEQNINTEHKENDTLPPQNVIDNDKESSAARIKVKPLAELLSKEGFMNTFVNGNPNISNPLSQDKQPKMFTCVIKANDFIQASHITPQSYLGLASRAIPVSPTIQTSHIGQINDKAPTNYAAATIDAVHPNLIVQAKEINKTATPDKIKQATQAPQQSHAQTITKLAVQAEPSSAPPNNAEFVIMDTVELPSTKTKSPIQYLEHLLLIHNIYLLDQTKHDLSHSFVCLIKFKVLYKQETMNEPILLSLSLFCHKNNFCMKVKNVNQENIDISKISANWQWEIIKVFKGDVSNKLLQNAQKVNQETYEYAKTFLFLLKSINYSKV